MGALVAYPSGYVPMELIVSGIEIHRDDLAMAGVHLRKGGFSHASTSCFPCASPKTEVGRPVRGRWGQVFCYAGNKNSRAMQTKDSLTRIRHERGVTWKGASRWRPYCPMEGNGHAQWRPNSQIMIWRKWASRWREVAERGDVCHSSLCCQASGGLLLRAHHELDQWGFIK